MVVYTTVEERPFQGRVTNRSEDGFSPVVASACLTGAKAQISAVRRGADAPLFHGDPNSCLRASSKEQPDGLELAAIKFPLGELRIVPPSARNYGGNNAEIRDRA